MATTYQPEVERCKNLTGATIAQNALVTIDVTNGFDTQDRSPRVMLAVANGANRLAIGVMGETLASARTGYFKRDTILENVNTTGASAPGEPVWLSPTVPGGYLVGTANKPTGLGYDVQQVGVVLTVHATLGRIKFQIMNALAMPQGVITSSMLNDKPYFDPGRGSIGYVNVTGAVTAGERITIITRVYEFQPAGTPIGAGADVAINPAGASPWAVAATVGFAIAAAINADAGASVDAQFIAGTGFVALFSKIRSVTTGATDYAIATTAANITVVSLTGGTAAGRINLLTFSRAISAGDVIVLATVLGTSEIAVASFTENTQPHLISAYASRLTGGGVVATNLALIDGVFVWRQVNARQYGLFYREPVAGALLQAGDALSIAIASRATSP